jgi:outer membrane protein assembly factor BamD (BamD/ComL family)
MAVFGLVFILLAAGGGDPERAPQGRDLYYQAVDIARAGNPAEAVSRLQKILDQWPEDPFADDALIEQARLHEEVLGAPGRALELYRSLIERYPSSRVVRRAKARARFLEKNLGQGQEVLRDYLRIQKESAKVPAAESVERMLSLLAKHQDFSLRPDGLYWAGSLLGRESELDRAREILSSVARSYPEHPMAGRSLLELGNLEIRAGRLDAAGEVFEKLGKLPGGTWEQSAREAGKRLAMIRLKQGAVTLAVIVWLLCALVLWVALVLAIGRKRLALGRLARPPIEALVYLAIMLVLIVWAGTGARQTTQALLWMTGMLMLILLPNGWLLSIRTLSGRMFGLRLACLVVACVAGVVAAIGLAGMTDQVLHTFQHGPGG